jgi:hypothetical protein
MSKIGVQQESSDQAFGQDPMTFPVKYMSPTAVLPYFRNAKKHDRRQITLLAKAIRTSGFDQPIVVDKDLVIIKGHARRLAALELKMDLVPVVVRDDLSPEECVASRIADNQVATMTSVDKAMEQQEILDYVGAGGHDAAIFFDFMDTSNSYGKQAKVLPGAATPAPAPKPNPVAGNLETCPKCGHTFMEIPK